MVLYLSYISIYPYPLKMFVGFGSFKSMQMAMMLGFFLLLLFAAAAYASLEPEWLLHLRLL